MINIKPFSLQKIPALFALVTSVLLLQACGGQRDEPFDPDGKNTSSRGDAVTIKELRSGENPIGGVGESSKLITISDSDTFAVEWKLYTNSDFPPTVDWSDSQVLLVDLGRTTNCDIKSRIADISAYQYSDTRVQVIIDYGLSTSSSSSTSTSSSSTTGVSSSTTSSSSINSSSSSSRSHSSSNSSAASSCSNVNLIQRYYFFSIETRDSVFFDETGD